MSVICLVFCILTSCSQSSSHDDARLEGEINGHEYIDLGLPSGLKWASCNIGADNPEEFGDYFAWGELTSKTEYKKEITRVD